MKAKYSSTISILFSFASLLTMGSCKDDIQTIHARDEIRFSISSRSVDTKASYSGITSSGKERIDWTEGDMIRVYCAQVVKPDDKYADYVVSEVGTPDGAKASAEISASDGVSLWWGDGEHTFYAAYPSPAASGATKSIEGKTVTAEIPAVQSVTGSITQTDGNWTAAPDLKNMLMTAKAKYSPETGIPEGSVFLDFTPVTTAIKFTITNDTGAELDLTAVQLISGNGKASASVISGGFTVDLDQTGVKSGDTATPYTGNEYKITYSQDYPKCTSTKTTSTDQAADRTLTINVGTTAKPLALAKGKTFTFTFFLNPGQDHQDLTLKLLKADGGWQSTRLGYTDGEGIFFPRHKKSEVKGILVPEGAKYYAALASMIVPWDKGISEEVEMTK